MSDSVNPPSFYFTVDHLESLYPRWVNGRWQPSRKKEHHTIVGASRSSQRAIFYDGQTQRVWSELVRVAGPAEPTQCYSLYKDRTNNLWIVDHDVTEETTGNGQDAQVLPDDDEDEEEENNDWSCLTFRRNGMGPVKCSYAGYGEAYTHVQFSSGQATGWMQHLLPRGCHVGRSTERINAPHGLIGDLALLLGLIAISLPTIHMKRMLPLLLRRQWGWPTTDSYAPSHQRVTGVRIKLWLATAAPNSSRTFDAEFAARNTPTRLTFFQEGGCGPIIGGT